MELQAYLRRLNYQGPLSPTRQVLTELHRAHMQAIPFENLDIAMGRTIVLDLPQLFDKVIVNKRGGFCYELNSLFGWLLDQVGFEVHMLQAAVFGKDGQRGPDFDHMLLMVHGQQDMIADVGFGDSFIEPLPFRGGPSQQQSGCFQIHEMADGQHLQRRDTEGGWSSQYVFDTKAHKLDAFEAMCHYQQTSPQSTFTQKSVCSRATETGRITLANQRRIVTRNGQKHEQTIADAAEYRGYLKRDFGFLDGDIMPVDRFMEKR